MFTLIFHFPDSLPNGATTYLVDFNDDPSCQFTEEGFKKENFRDMLLAGPTIFAMKDTAIVAIWNIDEGRWD
jgi:hypothetical protein